MNSLSVRVTRSFSTTAVSAGRPRGSKLPKLPKADLRRRIPAVLEPPTRPANSFALFAKDRHASGEFKHFPKMSDAIRAISEEWKQMSPSAKAVYEQKGVELKQKYEVDLAAFWEKASPEDIEAENKRRKTMAANGGKKLIKLKDPNAPKRPSIAYIHFVKEFVAEYASTSDNGTGGGSSVIKAGAAWNALAPEQKQKYEEMAKEDKQRYLRELEAYRNKSVY